MRKKPLNCWEVKGCGREPGGVNSEEKGVCPASVEKSLDGIHRGDNAGRSCWIIAGTFCDGRVQGTYAEKYNDCEKCDFFQRVMAEEKTTINEANDLLQAISIVSRTI